MILCSLINCHHGGQKTSQLHEDDCAVYSRPVELNSEFWKKLCYKVFDDHFTVFFFLALYTGIIICIKENNINIY